MARICTSPYPSPYPTEKVRDFPYPYPYPVNTRISHQNENGFEQYPQERIYLSSLLVDACTWSRICGADSFCIQYN